MTKRQFFIRYGKQYLPALIGLALLTLGSTGTVLLAPQLVRGFLDAATAGHPLSALVRIAVLYIVVALATQLLKTAQTYVGELIAWLATNRLREDLARHCLGLDMNFHKTHKPGELMERLDNDVNETRGFFSSLFTDMAATIPLLFGVIVMLGREDWRIGLSVLVLCILAILVYPHINKHRVAHIARVREVHAQLSGNLQEWVQGREDIQASGSTAVIMNRLHHRYSERYKASLRLLPSNILGQSIPGLTLFLVYVLIYGFSSGLGGYGLSISSFAMILLYIEKLEQPIYVLQHSVLWMSNAQAAFDRITELLSEQPSLTIGTQGLEAGSGLGLRVDRLCFAYQDRQVLRDVSLRLEPGEHLGLLGRTGSGKTTLTRLIMHLYEPDAGSILLGDGLIWQRPAELRPDQLKRTCALVTQEVELLNASVRDNLSLFDGSITDSALLDALEAVSMLDWLEAQPGGLDSRMNGSHGLSSGQAQLLALARVFLRDPSMVILDEASSRLDLATERSMQRAVRRLLAGRTAIIIAHRLDTIEHVDKILILDEGRVLEEGYRTDLVADQDSRFNQLLKTGLEAVLA